MTDVRVRYVVDDVDAAIDFYTGCLGFTVRARPALGFAALDRGSLTLLLNAPGAGGAGARMPDGQQPTPGGWNRFQIVVDDLDEVVMRLRRDSVTFRTEIIYGKGGRQILVEDPSGNPVELFQPHAP